MDLFAHILHIKLVSLARIRTESGQYNICIVLLSWDGAFEIFLA